MSARPLPVLTPLNTAFWTGGRDGHLSILHCCACSAWLHPPAPICPCCMGQELVPQNVSGMGVIEAFTVNHQVWFPGGATPYIIAIVRLVDCPGVRLTTNIVGVTADDIRIGMPVSAKFEQHEDVWLPLFTPS
jgi:uncharacterized protein